MIDKLRMHGLVRMVAEILPTGEWEVRLSKCASGQGDVISRSKRPDEALQGASDLFLQFSRSTPTTDKEKAPAASPAKPKRKVTRGWPADLPEDGSHLI